MMLKDYLNIWMMLSLSGLSRYSKDISLLNMDDFLPSHHHHQRHRKRSPNQGLDVMNHFFKNYNVSFRRLLKASEFMTTTTTTTSQSAAVPPRVCIKRLLLPPKPLVGYHWDMKETHDPLNHYDCPMIFISSLLQRWNLQVRHHYQLFSSPTSTSTSSLGISRNTNEELPTNQQMKILVLVRSNHTRMIPSISTTTSTHYLSRIILNDEAIIQRLQQVVAAKITTVDIIVEKVIELVHSYSYEEQVKLFHTASIIIGMNGGEIATGNIHLPIGTRYCCGVIEIFPDSSSNSGSSSSSAGSGENPAKLGLKTGYGQLARRLGHVYQRMDLSGVMMNSNQTVKGSMIPLDRLEEAVTTVYQEIIRKQGSCFLPEVLKTPYL